MEKFLHRSDAPFDEKLWTLIDETVVGAAKSQLSARRIIEIDGPYGPGLKFIAGKDAVSKDAKAADVLASPALPVVALQKPFSLAMRDIAHFEETHLPPDMESAALAALDCARQEDHILLYGSEPLGIKGLLNASGTLSQKLHKWDEVGRAADDVIKAVTALDDAGFHGPYALALAPALYNMLFRRYPQGDMVELDHVRAMVHSITKAPAIASGGVLLAQGKQYATIVLGQDLITRFVGPSGGDYQFSIFESLALRLLAPSSICVLHKE
jgi:uncharacterized linocin/CFP29 family protein